MIKKEKNNVKVGTKRWKSFKRKEEEEDEEEIQKEICLKNCNLLILDLLPTGYLRD